uniref:Uncharacterized protein LOC114344492 n=1 Tax=Diabrotica virgifera virgifera TaxID=50390 RepID=A0A6P7GMJ3_DIAVI
MTAPERKLKQKTIIKTVMRKNETITTFSTPTNGSVLKYRKVDEFWIKVIGNQISDLKKLIISLQNDIQELKAENVKIQPSTQQVDLEEVIEELNDRNRRKKNLVIFGVPDHSQQGEVDDDKLEVNKIINLLYPQFDISNLRLFRVGRFSDGRTRPIKVVLRDENQVLKLIRNSKVLRNGNYKNVSVASDRTPRQITHYKKLKEELIVKNSDGQQNFRIKYINGVPRIVQNLN